MFTLTISFAKVGNQNIVLKLGKVEVKLKDKWEKSHNTIILECVFFSMVSLLDY